MIRNSEQIIQRIKQIRKSKRLSVKDCAKALGVSKETYRNIEEGNRPLSLPEFDLLTFFLGVDPTVLLKNDRGFTPQPNLLRKSIRSDYVNLRTKMIGALLTATRESEHITFEDVHHATRIPEDMLRAYENGELPIPLSDLSKISDYLEIPYYKLYQPVWLMDTNQEEIPMTHDWEPELTTERNEQQPHEDDIYLILLQALKQMPKSDQAHIAKIILEKLNI